MEQLVTAATNDTAALDRLIELAAGDGQQARVEELLGRKDEIGRLEARRESLYRRNQPSRDAAEMARLAERLGFPFEARAYLTVAIGVEPGREDLRRELESLELRARAAELRRGTLADEVAREFDAAGSRPAGS